MTTSYTARVVFSATRPNAAGWLEMAGEMPALTGSEKQIAWATDIRHTFSRKLAEYLAKAAKANASLIMPGDTEHAAEIEATIEAAINALPRGDVFRAAIAEAFAHTDAKWWIDTARNVAPEAIILTIVRRLTSA